MHLYRNCLKKSAMQVCSYAYKYLDAAFEEHVKASQEHPAIPKFFGKVESFSGTADLQFQAPRQIFDGLTVDEKNDLAVAQIRSKLNRDGVKAREARDGRLQSDCIV